VNVPPILAHAGDPDVILLADGRFRMFLTTQVAGKIGIVCLESENGIDFSLQATAFSDPQLDLLDSTTYLAGGTWHMLAVEGMTMKQRHGTSRDGCTFEVGEERSFEVDGRPFIGSNPVPIEGGLRMYGFSLTPNQIRSLTSTDGVTWALEPGIRVAPTGPQIKDPAVVRLVDGSWLMIYTTKFE
jgi:hypothetical protein